jgi:hypothetical protein
MKTFNSITIFFLVIGAAFGLLWLRFSTFTLPLPVSALYLHEVSYQVVTLSLAGLFILLSLIFGGKGTPAYLNLSRLRGEVIPVRWLGITVKEGRNWLHLGIQFMLIFTLVTSTVIYFQVIHQKPVIVRFFRISYGFLFLRSAIPWLKRLFSDIR